MSNQDSVLIILSCILSALGLWVLICWYYRDLCVDWFRQRMFALRDELFDEAANGLLPFDHPAYGTLRSTMNGFIRFGHRLGLLQVLLLGLIIKKDLTELHDHSFETRWGRATDSLEASCKERLNHYLIKMNLLVLAYLVLGSPLMILSVVPLVALLAAWFFAKESLGRILGSHRSPLDTLDSAAMAYGGQ